MTENRIPLREEVALEDTWDLSMLFASDEAWSEGMRVYESQIDKLGAFQGTLENVDRENEPVGLCDFLDFYQEMSILEERLGYYSDLLQTVDEGNSDSTAMSGKFRMASARAEAAASWAIPEIQRIPEESMTAFLQHRRIAPYRIYLEKLLRFKPHILSEAEERIIAIHAEGDYIASQAFTVLTNVDMDFGVVKSPEGDLPLSQSTWSAIIENPDRELRSAAYMQFYGIFDSHKTTLATLYSGSVKKDVIDARIRGFSSAREAALFPDKVDPVVYDNLIATVGNNLAPLHDYYALRKRALGLDTLRHYDVYVPIVKTASQRTPWNDAVDLIANALAPLGDEYVATLSGGLKSRWADRYENKGKRSGAFSAGSFSGDPHILINYKEEVIRDVFTLAHEGGHSMHSWYSARSNPFMQYRYTIFEAEVASTFNEELLFRYLLDHAQSQEFKTYIINKRVDDLLSTLYRQTMFAEFEKRTHELEESGTPLTVELLRQEYRTLLEKYFGPEMVLEEVSDLEGLRIPHFYRAFYVYKYATGVSASLSLADQVLAGGKAERDRYFAFLSSGGSRYPLESLAVAGVDMSKPEPVEAACRIFGALVEELKQVVD